MNLDKKTQLCGPFIHVKTPQKREGDKDRIEWKKEKQARNMSKSIATQQGGNDFAAIFLKKRKSILRLQENILHWEMLRNPVLRPISLATKRGK